MLKIQRTMEGINGAQGHNDACSAVSDGASERLRSVSPSLSEMDIIVVPPTSPIILITPDSDPVLAQHIVIIFPKEFNPP